MSKHNSRFLMVSVFVNVEQRKLKIEDTSSLQRILFLRLPAVEILWLGWQLERRCLHLEATTVTKREFSTCRIGIRCSFGIPSNFCHQMAVQLIYTSHFYYLCGLFKQHESSRFVQPRIPPSLAIVRPFSPFSTHCILLVWFFKVIMVILWS